MRCNTKLVTACGIAMSGTLLLTSDVSATLINVPADQPTIQEGINAAVNGDIVLVAPGTYNEAIDFNGKAITVQSSSGALVTTITGAGLGTTSVVKFITSETAASVLEGFTITSGNGTPNAVPLERRGGGIYALGADPTIKSCRILSNTAPPPPPNGRGYGGVVYHTGGAMTLIDCVINGNSTIGGGNPAAYGGGFYSTGTPLLLNCKIEFNTCAPGAFAGSSTGNGGGAYAPGATFINCDIRGNSVSGANAFGGGALGGSLYVNCRITGNNVSFGGGGFPMGGNCGVGSVGTMISCTVTGNTIVSPSGFAVGASTLRNCIVFGNGGSAQVTPSATVSHSCVQGGFAGTGNISADPLFVNAGGGDQHLQDASPCRDAGDRTLLPADTYDLDSDTNTAESLSRDHDLLRRIVNGQVDMGAYEWQRTCLTDISRSSPGMAGDGVTNIGDLLAVIAGWGPCDQCNADVNNDDLVNVADLLAVIAGWGPC